MKPSHLVADGTALLERGDCAAVGVSPQVLLQLGLLGEGEGRLVEVAEEPAAGQLHLLAGVLLGVLVVVEDHQAQL